MSNAEENLTTPETEEIDLHATHTEVGEHEYTLDELKTELAETKKAAEEALAAAIKMATPGRKTGEIGSWCEDVEGKNQRSIRSSYQEN